MFTFLTQNDLIGNILTLFLLLLLLRRDAVARGVGSVVGDADEATEGEINEEEKGELCAAVGTAVGTEDSAEDEEDDDDDDDEARVVSFLLLLFKDDMTFSVFLLSSTYHSPVVSAFVISAIPLGFDSPVSLVTTAKLQVWLSGNFCSSASINDIFKIVLLYSVSSNEYKSSDSCSCC